MDVRALLGVHRRHDRGVTGWIANPSAPEKAPSTHGRREDIHGKQQCGKDFVIDPPLGLGCRGAGRPRGGLDPPAAQGMGKKARAKLKEHGVDDAADKSSAHPDKRKLSGSAGRKKRP